MKIEKDKIKKWIKEMRKKIPKSINMTPFPDDLIKAFRVEDQGYNKALDDILEKLDENLIDNKETKDNEKDNISAIYTFYQTKIYSGNRLTDRAKQKISSRLKEFSIDDIKKAIMNFSKNDWWMKNNSNRGLVWFFHSEDRIDQFVNLQPDRRNVKEKLWR